jgi:hypothetical protein
MQDQLEWLWEGIKVTIGPIVGFLCGHVSGSFGQKRAQTARVLERYIQAAGQQREAQNDAAFRMGLLQRSGAAELSRRQLARLAARVVAHGLTDPLTGYDHFSDCRKDPYRLLRWANNEGINLWPCCPCLDARRLADNAFVLGRDERQTCRAHSPVAVRATTRRSVESQ